MTTNTDPVRAHDELRVQAALLRTPEFMAQFDPEKFARQLERIATALAAAPQQPAAVDEAMVDRAGQALYGTDWGSFEGWEADQLRRKVRAVLTAALASAFPSVPVGVDREEEYAALPHQPAAVDEARSVSSIMDGAVAFVEAIAAQLGGSDNDR